MLEFLKDMDVYCEIEKDEMSKVVLSYIEKFKISKDDFDKYLQFYPEKIYKSIYEAGVVNAFARK